MMRNSNIGEFVLKNSILIACEIIINDFRNVKKNVLRVVHEQIFEVKKKLPNSEYFSASYEITLPIIIMYFSKTYLLHMT